MPRGTGEPGSRPDALRDERPSCGLSDREETSHKPTLRDVPQIKASLLFWKMSRSRKAEGRPQTGGGSGVAGGGSRPRMDTVWTLGRHEHVSRQWQRWGSLCPRRYPGGALRAERGRGARVRESGASWIRL